MQPWSTLPQMSPRGHCGHSCHIKVLCILKESVRGAEVLFTRLRKESTQKGSHQTEDLRKFKGNVEKSYAEISHLRILLMEPQINFLSPTQISQWQGKTHPQRCSCIQAEALLRSLLVVLWCLLCFCSLSSGSDRTLPSVGVSGEWRVLHQIIHG